MRIAVAAAIAASALVLASPAVGRTLDVRPGKNAIARALDRASAGDTLLIHAGRYRESVEITKRVSLVGAVGERRPTIDGDCRTRFTVAVRRPGVELRGLRVVGADEGFGPFPSEVDFSNVASGRARDLVLRDTCDAEYGINVFDTGPVWLIGNEARGFSDAGLYVGGIEDTHGGAISVRANETYGNNRGVIVEDSTGGRIVVRDNELHDNRAPGEGEPTGIWLHDSDGVRIVGNSITDSGALGIHLSAGSDANVLNDNIVRRNPTNLLDEGSGNCGSGNRFGSSGNVLPPC